ncbi:fimbrial protein, partial [Escherichia coli]|uniref:fimbrial protein n=1 Tax=Escherichia coli TaxID=562 RepID=UPI002022EEC2
EKRVFLVILFTSFSESLVSRIPGAVQTGASTATGVGLRIYKNTDSAPLKFGPDSPLKGNENQWQLSTGTETSPSVRLYVKYVNTGEGINPGTVNGVSTFTFSYQ